MVQDATGLAHAGRGDDDRRMFEVVESLGFCDRTAHVQVCKGEGVSAGKQSGVHLPVHALCMCAKQLRGADGHRAIHEYLRLAKQTVLKSMVEQKEKLLRALYSKRGNIDFSPARKSLLDLTVEAFIIPSRRFMAPSTVRALHEHDIHVIHGRWVAQKLVVAPSHVSGEEQPLVDTVFMVVNVQHDLSGAENMSGIVESESNTVIDEHSPLITNGYK